MASALGSAGGDREDAAELRASVVEDLQMRRPLAAMETVAKAPGQARQRPQSRASDSMRASLKIRPSLQEGGIASSFKTGGVAPAALFADSPSVLLEEPRRQTILFSKEAEDEMQTQDPQTLHFLGSSQGVFWQAMLIFVYIHFDAGLPLLQDVYKKFYGGGKLLFTKQTLLITQNICEIASLILVTKLLRGSYRDALNFKKTVLFAPAGAAFGIQAVFGFLAMSEITADCYAMYAQSSIVVLTLAWSIFFRRRLSGTCWIGVIMIAVGMVGFNMSDGASTTLGLVYVGCKISCQAFAVIYAEQFVKTDPETLYIQMAWMKPAELLFTVVMMFVIPAKPGSRSAVQEICEDGFFHDWNWLVVVIMVFNMGDTALTATVAKQFDSVVKGVASVADIIYPTQVFVQLLEPPVYTGLKVISGAAIVCGSLNFVLAKGEMRRSQERQTEIEDLKDQLARAGCRASA